jgi:hypothetical protein
LPAGRRLRQDLGFLACTREPVAMIMPTKQPRGRALTRPQHAAPRRLARRRVRMEHVTSSVKRGRRVHDPCRLGPAGRRALRLDVCGAVPNFRGRLPPWPPMVSSG